MWLAVTQSDLAQWWAPALAFLAGVVSFASPCVFPLVPGYVSFVTGERATEETRPAARADPAVRRRVRAGVHAARRVQLAVGAEDRRRDRGSGSPARSCSIVGVLMVDVRARQGVGPDVRRAPPVPAEGPARSGVGGAAGHGVRARMDAVHRAGAGGILGLASQGGTARGTLLLLCYSAGLGLPFVLVGLGVSGSWAAAGGCSANYRSITGVSGGAADGARRPADHRGSSPGCSRRSPAGSRPACDGRLVSTPRPSIAAAPRIGRLDVHLRPRHPARDPPPVRGDGLADPALDADRADPAVPARDGLGRGVADPQIPNSPSGWRAIRSSIRSSARSTGAPASSTSSARGGSRSSRRCCSCRSSPACCRARRAHLRAIRQRPVHARELDSFPQYAERRVAAPPDRGRRPESEGLAPQAVPGEPRTDARRRRREGDRARVRQPAVPLGVPADPRRRGVRQGDRIQREGRGGGGADVDRRARQLRRRDPHRPLLLRATSPARNSGSSTSRTATDRPVSPWTSCRRWR